MSSTGKWEKIERDVERKLSCKKFYKTAFRRNPKLENRLFPSGERIELVLFVPSLVVDYCMHKAQFCERKTATFV